MTQSDTVYTKYGFIAKEFSDGTPFIIFEPESPDNLKYILRDGFLLFDLPKGTTLSEAYKIAKFMNDNLGKLGYTYFLPELPTE